jgi:hypothetical protein
MLRTLVPHPLLDLLEQGSHAVHQLGHLRDGYAERGARLRLAVRAGYSQNDAGDTMSDLRLDHVVCEKNRPTADHVKSPGAGCDTSDLPSDSPVEKQDRW